MTRQTTAVETRVSVRQVDATVTVATARQHEVVIDRPVDAGGTDEGAKARELFLMALGGCFINNLKAAINARDADIQDVHVDVIGTADGPPRRYVAIEMVVHARYTDDALMQKIVTIAERGCLLSNTLKGSVDMSVTIAPSGD
ncbi:MAG: OsmC family protein [Chloroflexota bacterium]